MRFVFMGILILLSPLPRGNPEPAGHYAGICRRRCETRNTSRLVEATLVDPLRRRKSRERVYLYKTGNPCVACRCSSELVRHRTRAIRESTNFLVHDCLINCRGGIRLFDTIVVDPDGREHNESISVLSYNSPVGCLCTGIPVEPRPPAPPRRHPDR